MPLPVLHSFAGYSLYRLTRKKNEGRKWRLILLSVLLANLADFDFLPGIQLGEATRYHRALTHTLGAAFLCGALVGLASWIVKKRAGLKNFLLASGVYFSHLVLDYIFGAPEGLLIFWPFTKTRFYSSTFPLRTHSALDFSNATNLPEFLGIFFSPLCVSALFLELTIVFSLWAASEIWRDLKKWSRIEEPVVFFTRGPGPFLLD